MTHDSRPTTRRGIASSVASLPPRNAQKVPQFHPATPIRRLPHPPKPANLKPVRIETPVGHPLRPLMTTTTPAPTTSDVEQLARLARAVEQLRSQVARRIVGQEEVGRGDPDRHPGRRARPADRRARAGQDPDGLRRWPRRSTSRSTGSSSPPTSCRATSPAPRSSRRT